ncbi:MAG TPA: hypothetical protein DCP11_04460 [Microbacteriaceae bacterium]|nr:hypothetical protein [Microbacteriaceae bacterium]
MELLHSAAIVPAVVAACCAAGARRHLLGSVLPSLLMILSMLDLASGSGVLWPIAWVALLLAVSPVPVAMARRGGMPIGRMSPPEMALHTSIGLVVMAALTAFGGSKPMEQAGHHTMPPVLMAVVGIVVGVYLVFTVVLAGSLSRAPRRSALLEVEVAGMGVSIALMAIAGFWMAG